MQLFKYLLLLALLYIWWKAIRYPRNRFKSKQQKFSNSLNKAYLRPTNMLRYLKEHHQANWPKHLIKTKQLKPKAKFDGSELKITFINHASFLIQTQGLNIITDPIWSKRASPFSFAGPKRYRTPGVELENLPKIDIVLISHDHYDHLDLPSLRKIIKRDNPRIYTGLGVGSHLDSKHKVRELDWWEETNFHSKLKITYVPAKHFSGRYLLERNSTLWGGFVLSLGEDNILFMGDTGMGDFIHEIKAKFQKFKLALIPIGAYKPRWMMKEIHMDPQEGVEAHEILKAQYSIAMHFGTFDLATEGYMQAEQAFKLAAIHSKNFILPHNGQEFIL